VTRTPTSRSSRSRPPRPPDQRPGDCDQLAAGDRIPAIGNPFGIDIVVTSGTISARGCDLHGEPYDDLYPVEAPINRGTSGGPACGDERQVVGIETAICSPHGGNVGVASQSRPASVKPSVSDDLIRV
jgi:serine protease Do